LPDLVHEEARACFETAGRKSDRFLHVAHARPPSVAERALRKVEGFLGTGLIRLGPIGEMKHMDRAWGVPGQQRGDVRIGLEFRPEPRSKPMERLA
jgi:hypothetical protein